MAKYLRIAGAILLALTIILSCTVVGNKLTDPATYAHTIEVLDHNRTTILGLTAASAAASAKLFTVSTGKSLLQAAQCSVCSSLLNASGAPQHGHLYSNTLIEVPSHISIR